MNRSAFYQLLCIRQLKFHAWLKCITTQKVGQSCWWGPIGWGAYFIIERWRTHFQLTTQWFGASTKLTGKGISRFEKETCDGVDTGTPMLASNVTQSAGNLQVLTFKNGSHWFHFYFFSSFRLAILFWKQIDLLR